MENDHDFTAQYTESDHVAVTVEAAPHHAPLEASALEKLLNARQSALNGEAKSCLITGAFFGIPLGTLVLFGPLLNAEEGTVFTVWAISMVIATLLLYPFIQSYMKRYYQSARDLMASSSLPKLVLERDFIERVLEAVNTNFAIFNVRPPASRFDDEVRFLARYWYFTMWVLDQMSGKERRLSEIKMFSLTNRYDNRWEPIRAPFREHAICDYFIEHAGARSITD